MADKKFRASDAKELKYIMMDDKSLFEVPPFQRAYTWRSSNINELWNSILENDTGYFIGNMVWLDNNDSYLIIDGQQRMFTLALTLIALENHWGIIKSRIEDVERKKSIQDWIDEIHSILYFKDKSQIPSQEKIRLTLSKDNLQEVFLYISKHNITDIRTTKEINERPLDENQKVFTRNYKHIYKLIKNELSDANDDEKIEKLRTITNKIIQLFIIPIKCDSDIDAYKIFEGLNATGIALSVVDLVKNAVMYSIQDDQYREDVETLWEELENLFETTKWNLFQKFLRHHWIATENYVTNSKLFEAIKEKKLFEKTSEEIIDYTQNLLNCAQLYVGFREHSKRDFLKEKYKQKGMKENEIKEILYQLDNFQLLSNEQVYEVILSITLRYLKEEHFTYKQYNRYLENLWAFIFRAGIISINPSEYEKVFSKHCNYINNFEGKKFNKILTEQKKVLAPLVHGEEKDNLFISEFKEDTSLIYRPGGSNGLITYVLKTIVEEDNPEVETKEPTIEHILPQDPSKWNFERKEIEEYVNKIGNLTCLNKKLNQKASNLPIKEKYQKVFKESEFEINKNISDYLDLYIKKPLEAIEKRAEVYSLKANDIWVVK
jgi:uncharacterized protein with ParB-like and HNH nuclease domain